MIAAAKAIGCDRSRFDRYQQARVQPQPTTVVETDRRAAQVERYSLGKAEE